MVEVPDVHKLHVHKLCGHAACSKAPALIWRSALQHQPFRQARSRRRTPSSSSRFSAFEHSLPCSPEKQNGLTMSLYIFLSVQSLLDAPDIQAAVLAAMLHAAARLSTVEGVHSSINLSGAPAAGVGFHAAQGACLQGFERCLHWPQSQQCFADGKAYSAVRYLSGTSIRFHMRIAVPALRVYSTMCREI